MSKDYTKYSILDFVEDDFFNSYIIDGQPESAIFWEKWIVDHPEMHGTISSAKEILLEFQVVEEELPQPKVDSLFQKINSSIEKSNTKPSVKVIPWPRYVSIAASIVLLIGLWFFWPSEGIRSYETDLADRKEIHLPDQSEVLLNAESQLTFSKKGWETNRTVRLVGEAFFEVEKGSEFIVQTEIGEVTVLGTSFNVLMRGPYFEVYCQTGRVQVSVTDQENSLVLSAGEGTLYNGQTGKFEKIQMANGHELWTEGRITFSDKPLKFVIQELERQYNTVIEAPGLEKSYSGTLTMNNLEQALYDLTWPLKLKYKIEQDLVTISE